MISIENIEVTGWEAAIRGMRNPLNSWDKSDSFQCDSIGCYFESCPTYDKGFNGCYTLGEYIVGNKDLELMTKLAKAGSDHAKYRRFITVTADVTAPLYWWKEYDTYKVGTVANSCSTMHKITEKEFTLDDFSHEHLTDEWVDDDNVNLVYYNDEYGNTPQDILSFIVDALNQYRELYLETKDKKYWWQLIQLLPSSYNQRRTIQLNYEVLANMYHSRKNHKLDEWREFCKWSKELPYSELITC